MEFSHSHNDRDDVIAYLRQIGFPEKHLFTERQAIIKESLH